MVRYTLKILHHLRLIFSSRTIALQSLAAIHPPMNEYCYLKQTSPEFSFSQCDIFRISNNLGLNKNQFKPRLSDKYLDVKGW